GERAQADALRALGRGAQEDARLRRHADRVPVMLGEVIAVDAERVRRLDELDALFVELRQRRIAAIKVIENSDFHDCRAFAPCLRSLPRRKDRRAARREQCADLGYGFWRAAIK